ncbi:MAG TPA: phosphate ABC transporter permease subunit PstC [Candidatus Fraserbacteria bacterium]|nr:phosphate ABC transporter permease subunit PstC [Candidatus Fraserbacteria bacterium]
MSRTLPQAKKAWLQRRRLPWADRAFWATTALFAFGILLLVSLIVYQLTVSAWPSLTKFGLGFLSGTTWDPVDAPGHNLFGALPFIYGTIISALLALLIAVPLSLGVAIFLTELAPAWLRPPVSFAVELLAAIPSVVYGFWGITTLIPWSRAHFEPWLAHSLGFLPLFQDRGSAHDMLSAGFILAIMILPIISAVAREILLAVPSTQREALLALGATRWEVVRRVVLPYSRSGLLGAVILGLGRALGETMAVTMVIGNSPQILLSLLRPADTIASRIANEFTEANSPLHLSALIELGLVLFALTLLVNALARLLVWRVARRPEGTMHV